MRGLLSSQLNRGTGLLNMDLNQPDYAALMRGVDQAVAARPQAQPDRKRVSGWRVLDRVLGGDTITGGLDAERARLQAEADAPARKALQSRLTEIARGMGPAAELAFASNPAEFAKNVSEQFAPQVISAGGVQSIAGTGQRTAAPSFETVNDTIYRRDPISGAVEATVTAPPSFGDVTARQKAESDAALARDRLSLDQQTAGYTLSPTEVRYGANNEVVAANTMPSAAQEKAALEQAQQAEQQAARRQASVRQAENTLSAVDTALKQVGVWTTGPLSGLAAIGGTPAADLASTIDTIEANLSFQALQEMRDNSPTGGALGSITERELSLLGSTVASLRQSQSQSQLRRNLETIKGSLQRLRDAQSQAAASPASNGQPVRVQSQAQYQSLPSGTTYIAPDGSVRRKP